ncbi:MAG: SHOCT domain-containing protein [Acidimicrobiia bacterium]
MTTLLLASHSWHGHHGFFPWFPLVPLFFIGLWVTAFVLITRRWRRFGCAGGPGGESVLAERYARGEIDEAEYLERRSVLRGTGKA